MGCYMDFVQTLTEFVYDMKDEICSLNQARDSGDIAHEVAILNVYSC